jgi:hypothetical protein
MAAPKKNVAYTYYISLMDVAATGKYKANPTIAAGDFKVSIDGGEYTNLTTLPVVEPSGSISVKISLSQAEMNGDLIIVQCIDVAGAEWTDATIYIETDDVTLNDLVRSTTPANTLNVSADGLADADVIELGGSATALNTLAALYDGAVCTGIVNTVTSASDFTLTSSNLSSFTGDYDNMWLVLLNNNNRFIPRLIGTYTGGTKRVQFTGSGMAGAFPQSVNPGDTWMIISGSL